jgi:cytochrome c oxidase subunit II
LAGCTHTDAGYWGEGIMPGKIFAVIVVIVTLVTAYCVIAHVWWVPVDISVHGPKIDQQLEETIFGAGILFIAGQLVLAAFSFMFGDSKGARKMKAFPGGAKPLIIFAFVVVGIEILVLSFVGSKAWGAVYFTPPDPDSLRVDVQAGQFAYYFRYPGPDGKFGSLHPDLINEGTQNYFGLDPDHDPDAKDDIVTAEVAIPVNKPILLTLHSKDVGHSFYVRELRVQQDFVPGIVIPIHFTATQTGRFEIVCTQLCGLGHYNMKAYLSVLSQGDFDDWLRKQAAAQ